MTLRTRHVSKFRRFERLKVMAVARALRLRKADFSRDRPIVSIIGDHISDRIRAEGIYERTALEILRDNILDLRASSKMVAIDVGANIGNHSLFLSDLFAKVVAFEPNPLARSLLQINLDINGVGNVEVRPVGLSDRTERKVLVYEKVNLGAARLKCSSDYGDTATIELAVGDDQIDFTDPIGFIKVDVEGAEEAVLRGLERTIRHHRPILMIEQLEGEVDVMTGTSRTFTFLHDLGYSAMVIRVESLLGSKLALLLALVSGRRTHRLERIARLEKQNYPALFFLPD